MNLAHLQQKIDQAMIKFPSRAGELRDLFYLAQDEIADGESTENEITLALDSLEEIYQEEKLKEKVNA